MNHKKENRKRKFVVCIDNQNHPASLELRKIYERLPDPDSERHELIRVIDEDGEGYLYPSHYFAPVDLPKQTQEAVDSAAELEAQRR
jgi:hypothetical protein